MIGFAEGASIKGRPRWILGDATKTKPVENEMDSGPREDEKASATDFVGMLPA